MSSTKQNAQLAVLVIRGDKVVIEALIFDCFGVLYVPSGELAARSGQASQELIELTKRADYGLITYQEFTKAASKLTNLPPDQLSRLTRDDELLTYIAQLRKQYKVGMLSNISVHIMEEFFTTQEREQLFDDVVLSSEVGLIKPYPAIFELAASRLGVRPEAAVMVDDTEANITGARQAGLQAIKYSSLPKLRVEFGRLGIT